MDATYKTCKLALPLFFLVVRTNVGYSVVAEFIIQQEDTTSISEALSILRNKWDQLDIEVGNFMIDCQQSEENAIRAVFPDSVVYLCAFPQTAGMASGGSWTPRTAWVTTRPTVWDFLEWWGTQKPKMRTRKRWWPSRSLIVWSRYPNFRNYYSKPVGSKEEGKHNERVGRYWYICLLVGGGKVLSNLFAGCGSKPIALGGNSTTTRTTGLRPRTKRLNILFLNCCRNMSMSRLIYLLVQVFVPAQMAK